MLKAHMTCNEVRDLRTLVGRRIVTLVKWTGIPVGTEGVIDEIYSDAQGMMVAWNFDIQEQVFRKYCVLVNENQTLIACGGHTEKVGLARRMLWGGWTRDGFRRYEDSSQDELKFLELVPEPAPRILPTITV